MEGIEKLNINNKYCCEIKGFGEIFEIKSIERIRKRLKNKHGEGLLYLASNKDHSGRGFIKEEVENHLQTDDLKLIASGYADAPPWKSKPLQSGEKSNVIQNPLLSAIIPILFSIWIPLFEKKSKKRKKAHVVWAFGVNSES